MNGPITAVWPGRPYPRGATWDGDGVNFALFAQYAEKVELCLFDATGRHEVQRIALSEQTDRVWHCYLPEARFGLLYGYRVHGPYRPEDGHRFNANKLLLDPYAKALTGTINWSDALYGYQIGDEREDLSFDPRDSAAGMPKCRVIDPGFPWEDDRKPNIPWHETVLYELHVKGFTVQHPDVPPALRGTYAGLATPAVIEHLKRLGVTAVELLPVHACASERQLVEKGLRNYWGYNSIGYFAPDAHYSSSGKLSEFKAMVKAFHSAGIEVILDVVYNHTAEGNHLGPTLCFRGIDNACYYRLNADNRRLYTDYTGCGNTLNMQNPHVLQLIMDSLRYWVSQMHVDGFRFDLASALARELHEVDRLGAFFDIIRQDPVISQVKLIAEPWDLGEGGYQVGNFPHGWTEWNDKYRDTMRSYWKGDGGIIGEFAQRLTGSSDLYGRNGRRPHASVNFITCHDGFTLHDLVTYNEKHNEANLEFGRDGTNENRSWNCGVEGETDAPAVNALRAQQKRNFIATLLLSQGVPMLLAGDELGRTQRGNNNPYCQDNEISWVDWNMTPAREKLLQFATRMIRLRREHPIFRRRHFFQGRPIRGSEVKDIVWINTDGGEMTDAEWDESHARCLGVYFSGEGLTETDAHGRPLSDASFLVLINAHHDNIPFSLPQFLRNTRWLLIVDTAYEDGLARGPTIEAGNAYRLRGRSLVLLQQQKGSEWHPRAKGKAASDASARSASRRVKRAHAMPFGAEFLDAQRTRFRLWAPSARSVELVLTDENGHHAIDMPAAGDGWRELIARAGAGTRYRYRIDGKLEVPDPASRHNPQDVHGPSEVIDPRAYAWPDAGWSGRPWHEAVIYELHVGTFSPEGSFAGVESRLDYLARLGITAIELMPLADFPGRRGWGYDGTLQFAPDATYGRPEDLKRLVAAAHARGLMVFLDVIYNHFGPEGNYLHSYAAHFFTDRHKTDWGAGINVDGAHSRVVRAFFIHNALYWLEEFNLDGLRFDAVHAIADDSATHLLAELAEAVRRGPGAQREIHLMLENDRNEAHYLRYAHARPRQYNAQWNDDIHHAFHVLLTNETDGYYSDYAPDTTRHLGRCLAEGFAYQGEASPYRSGTPRGEPSTTAPPAAFVAFLQNHDQIGNRAFGERLPALAGAARLRAATVALLLAPATPLFFMGDEFAAATPFLFFCDFGPELARAVTEGRRREFARFERFSAPQARGAIPDPNAPDTFERSKLDWSCVNAPAHAPWLALYRRLLALRRTHLAPRLAGMVPCPGRYSVIAHGALVVTWRLGDGARLELRLNLSDCGASASTAPDGELLHCEPPEAAGQFGARELPPNAAAIFLSQPSGAP